MWVAARMSPSHQSDASRAAERTSMAAVAISLISDNWFVPYFRRQSGERGERIRPLHEWQILADLDESVSDEIWLN